MGIYIDIYFIVNFCLDYISLFITCIIYHKKTQTQRILLSATIGAGVSTLLFLKNSNLLSCTLLPITAYIMCRLLMNRRVFAAMLTFLAVGIFLGGILEAVQGVTSIHFSSPLLIVPITLFSIISGIVLVRIQSTIKKSMSVGTVNARIRFGEKISSVTLLVDSGNLIREPSCGKRVILLGRCVTEKMPIPYTTTSYPLTLKSANGTTYETVFEPDELEFDGDNYGNEKFLILPDRRVYDFGGFDGLVPIDNRMRSIK